MEEEPERKKNRATQHCKQSKLPLDKKCYVYYTINKNSNGKKANTNKRTLHGPFYNYFQCFLHLYQKHSDPEIFATKLRDSYNGLPTGFKDIPNYDFSKMKLNEYAVLNDNVAKAEAEKKLREMYPIFAIQNTDVDTLQLSDSKKKTLDTTQTGPLYCYTIYPDMREKVRFYYNKFGTVNIKRVNQDYTQITSFVHGSRQRQYLIYYSPEDTLKSGQKNPENELVHKVFPDQFVNPWDGEKIRMYGKVMIIGMTNNYNHKISEELQTKMDESDKSGIADKIDIIDIMETEKKSQKSEKGNKNKTKLSEDMFKSFIASAISSKTKSKTKEKPKSEKRKRDVSNQEEEDDD